MASKEEPLYRLSKSRKPIVFITVPLIGVIFFIVLVIMAGLFLLPRLINNTKTVSNQKATPTPIARTTNQETQGKLLGVWGEIQQIDRASTGSGEATIKLNADSSKNYQLTVGSKTKLSKYLGATSKSSPKLLADKIGWQDLSVGNRIYVTTTADLNKTTTPKLDEVTSIEWYLSP